MEGSKHRPTPHKDSLTITISKINRADENPELINIFTGKGIRETQQQELVIAKSMLDK